MNKVACYNNELFNKLDFFFFLSKTHNLNRKVCKSKGLSKEA